MTNTQIATLPPTERAVAALGFDTVKAEVEKLATQYADITAISNKAGRDQAHAAAMTLKNRRVEIQRRAKEVREDAVAFQKAVIAKGDELAALIEPEEQRLLKLRDAWDAEQERIKREAAEVEQRRKQAHEAKIDGIRAAASAAAGLPSAEIAKYVSAVEEADVSEASFEEYAPVAARAKAETLDKLRAMQAEAEDREAEQARIKAAQEAEAARIAAEREELARLRAEAEARRQEDERKAAEARAAEEARMAAERAELARQREAQEAQARAEREEIERQAAELRTQQEAIRKQQEANEAEARRIEQERADADRKATEEKARAEREEAARVEQERTEAEENLKRTQREANAPGSEELASVIASHYTVSTDTAYAWLTKAFGIRAA